MAMRENVPADESAQGELVIEYLFDAPRERVFKAWTECEQVMRWWGPRGFTTPVCEIDLRVGGEYRNCMRDPDGRDFCGKGTYREIVEPERLVMTDHFADEHWNVVPATHYGMSADFPTEMLVKATFEEDDGKTRLTLRHRGIPAGPDTEGARQGWSESFDKLAEYLASEVHRTHITAEPGKQELFIESEYDAPRELVFQAYTDPELYVRWLGPRELTMDLETFEPRSGGMWRYVEKDKDGNEYRFHGVIHEVLPPERIIDTFEYEGLPESGHVALQTARFEALPGDRTKVTAQAVFQSVADRDGMIESGMERGVNDSFDRLTELLAEMKMAKAA